MVDSALTWMSLYCGRSSGFATECNVSHQMREMFCGSSLPTCACVLRFFFQAEDGIRDDLVTGVQTCALPISLDVGEAEGQAYIAMELVEGVPLSERAHGRALPIDEVLGYGAQIAEALAHAHARGDRKSVV